MKLQNKVKIAGRTYDVEYLDMSEAVNSTTVCGNIVYYKQKIQIDTAAHREFQEMSLLHEIIHAIDNNLTLGLDEGTVRRLGMELYQVLKDNDFFSEGD